MATPPSFTAGSVLTAAQMNAVGLWLVKSQAVGSGVSSVSVSSAFTSDFTSYRIIWSGGTCSSNCQMWIQLGSSTTGYYGTLIYNSVTNATAAGATNNNNNRSDWCGGCGAANQAGHFSVELFNPNLAMYTKIRNGQYHDNDGYGAYHGEHKVATAYTSFTFGTAVGTMTGGVVRVYGFRE